MRVSSSACLELTLRDSSFWQGFIVARTEAPLKDAKAASLGVTLWEGGGGDVEAGVLENNTRI